MSQEEKGDEGTSDDIQIINFIYISLLFVACLHLIKGKIIVDTRTFLLITQQYFTKKKNATIIRFD